MVMFIGASCVLWENVLAEKKFGRFSYFGAKMLDKRVWNVV